MKIERHPDCRHIEGEIVGASQGVVKHVTDIFIAGNYFESLIDYLVYENQELLEKAKNK